MMLTVGSSPPKSPPKNSSVLPISTMINEVTNNRHTIAALLQVCFIDNLAPANDPIKSIDIIVYPIAFPDIVFFSISFARIHDVHANHVMHTTNPTAIPPGIESAFLPTTIDSFTCPLPFLLAFYCYRSPIILLRRIIITIKKHPLYRRFQR